MVGGGWWWYWYERVIVRVRLRWFHLFVNLFRGRLSRPFQISFLFCICYVCKCRYMYLYMDFSTFNIQVWLYLAPYVAVLISQWSCTHPPLVNTVSCRTCRTGELTTAWRRRWYVEDMTPLHPASPWPLPAGRQQLICWRRGSKTWLINNMYRNDILIHI